MDSSWFYFWWTLDGIINCLLYAVISAILSEALVFYALSKGNLSVSTVLIATYPVYTLLFSFFINNEKLTLMQILLVLITIIGTILTAFESDFKLKKLRTLSIIIPLITAISIGISDTLTKGIIDKTSSFDFLVAIAVVQIPVAIIYLFLAKQKPKMIIEDLKNGVKEYKYSIMGSLLNVIGTGCLLVSFNYTYASIASPLTAIYTPFVLIYSFIFLREKINKVNLVGVILALLGAFGIIVIV